MKILALLLITVFIASCTWENREGMVKDENWNRVKIEETKEAMPEETKMEEATIEETEVMPEETEVIEVQTERVKSEAELKNPERFDPVTGASLPDPR